MLEIQVEPRLPPAEPGVVEVRARARNTGGATLRPVECVLDIAELAQAGVAMDLAPWTDPRTRVFLNGYQSWSASGPVLAAERVPRYRTRLLSTMHEDPSEPSPGRPGRFVSHLFLALEAPDGSALCAGFTGAAGQLGRFRVDLASLPGGPPGRLQVVWPLDGRLLEPGEEVELDPLRLETAPAQGRAQAGGAVPLLERWAEALGKFPELPTGPLTGWCTWYQHYRKVSEAKVLAALAALRAQEIPADWVVVDDGWQRAIGDWEATSPTFAGGMAQLAVDVRAAGRRPGLWWAPLLVEARSELGRRRPELLRRNADGRPLWAGWNPQWNLFRSLRCLDPTLPEVEELLEEHARRMVRDWGYGLLKLDFLYAAALPGPYHDPRATRATALRRALQAVRRGAGKQALLLGCGCPLGPAVGLVNLMRVGPDVAPLWGGWRWPRLLGLRQGVATAAAVAASEARRFLHGRLWLNDPDCLIARRPGNRMNDAQVQRLAQEITAVDGVRFLGDDPASLDGDRLELARRVLGGA